MYKKGVSLGELENVKAEVPRSKRRESNPEPSYDRRLRDKSRSSRNSEFVYVNNAYVGSLSSVNEVRIEAPPTSLCPCGDGVRIQFTNPSLTHWYCKRRLTDKCFNISARVGKFKTKPYAIICDQLGIYVIREQYWACSKWPVAQRFLAIAVGILLGAVIGLVATLVVRAAAPEVDIGGIFKSSAPD